MNEGFQKLVQSISEIGEGFHREKILSNVRNNIGQIEKSLKELPAPAGAKLKSGIILSAGPSLKETNAIQRILDSGYDGSIISVDGAYVACLEKGLIPDYVLCLDPHATRIVRWFGDPDIEENSRGDDYFERQDLNIDFRLDKLGKNQSSIDLVNENAPRTTAIIATTVHSTVTNRLKQAGFDIYWWHPLVDDPLREHSITKQMYDMRKLPCFNTGGTVGTAAWVFANSILGIENIGVTGMDYGYRSDTPIEETQTYYELMLHKDSREISDYFINFTFPLNGKECYTDPTYYWYRENFLQLLNRQNNDIFNCSEAGTLFGDHVTCISLQDFLKKFGG
ncbi:MAG: DUF115 domain-containing protein [Leptospiraceae bacterium]